MDNETAEIIALQCLAWIAEADLLDAFQGATGADRAQITQAAGDPAFLAAILDFLFSRDDWVLAAASAQGRPPEDLSRARASLPGGAQMHWT